MGDTANIVPWAQINTSFKLLQYLAEYLKRTHFNIYLNGKKVFRAKILTRNVFKTVNISRSHREIEEKGKVSNKVLNYAILRMNYAISTLIKF